MPEQTKEQQKEQLAEAVGEALEAIAKAFDVANPEQQDQLHTALYRSIQFFHSLAVLGKDVPSRLNAAF